MMPAFDPQEQAEFLSLAEELTALRQAMLDLEAEGADLLAGLPADQRASGRNLLHYLALRRYDVRPLQHRLARLGLSSLGRAEAHALDNVETVLRLLGLLARRPTPPTRGDEPALRLEEGGRLLHRHAEKLLGPGRPERAVRIMVTLPGEAADRPALVEKLLAAGMDVLRINTAHDDATAWGRMIDHLRAAERVVGRTCRVLVDLAGPKLRTGPMTPGPQVVRVRPRRDELGREVVPARAWLHGAGQEARPPRPGAVPIPVPAGWVAGLRPGDQVHFRDARERHRRWRVVQVDPTGALAEGLRTAYLTPGTVLHRRRGGEADAAAAVGPLPALEQAIALTPGDTLLLTRDLVPGRPAERDASGNVVTPAQIGCTLREVFGGVRPGERISLDDGRFLGVVEEVAPDAVTVQITRVRGGTARLRGDKGINLPESRLAVPALTAKDLADLPFVARHADLVGYSFVRAPEDVAELQRRLAEVGGRQVGLVLKIETVAGFQRLPGLLLAALATGPAGVMIARGDLAVEAGFERLAEVQEEILWVCEAAHVPVIWATQVLEGLAREGMPSRAEITDAAMGTRAECVMLNKGPFVIDAVRTLDDILRRMADHQSKKRSMLRRLGLSRALDLAAPQEEDDD